MRILALTIAVCGALVAGGCGGEEPVETGSDASSRSKPDVKPPDGPPPKQLEKIELIEGAGPEARSGDEVTVQYVGVGYDRAKEFDSSWSHGEPYSFTLGNSELIGWDMGVEGMKVGGRREMIIPPKLAFGKAGSEPLIGPSESLIYVVDMLAVD